MTFYPALSTTHGALKAAYKMNKTFIPPCVHLVLDDIASEVFLMKTAQLFKRLVKQGSWTRVEIFLFAQNQFSSDVSYHSLALSPFQRQKPYAAISINNIIKDILNLKTGGVACLSILFLTTSSKYLEGF